MANEEDNNQGSEQAKTVSDHVSPDQMAQLLQLLKNPGILNALQQPAPVVQEPKKAPPKIGRSTRSFEYRGLNFFVVFDGEAANVSVADPKTKQPSMRARVSRGTYMKAVQAIAKMVLAEQDLKTMELAAKRKG